MNFYNKNYNEIIDEFKSNKDLGLSNQEVVKRQENNGLNILEEAEQKSIFRMLFDQINDVMIYVLLVAAAITVFVNHEITDAIIILLVVFVNAFVGIAQEIKANKSLQALKEMTNPKAIVIRDGNIKEIESKYLVVGDIVLLEAGRVVPADLRLIESINLQIEESSFTGESIPSSKNANVVFEDEVALADRKNMAYMSTLVTYGRGKGIVVATAKNTEIGKIAKMLEGDDEQTPLQKKMNKLGKTLGYIAMFICVLILVIGLLQGREFTDMLLTSISLAVAAIPEGLVAIIAIVLAMGVTRMSKKNAIIKKLPAVETLGSVNVICSDKTGTLTQNKMTVVETFSYNSENKLIETFILSSDAQIKNGEEIGDPTELALISYGEKNGVFRDKLDNINIRVDEYAFDSDRKLMSTLTFSNEEYTVNVKGAVDNLLKLCTKVIMDGNVLDISDDIKNYIMDKSIEMSNKALRVLACAYKKTNDKIDSSNFENDLIFIGLVGMIDPPREEVKKSIEKAHKAGIEVVMITGDHKNTAFAIAKNLNIATKEEQCMTGSDLDKLSDDELEKEVLNYRVFSRVSPEHKVKIVKALKNRGNIVSMTGDGVNDAPSLKIADIGVAMGITGTDVAKGASDMILTDDNFTTIVTAIDEGRNIYNNIKKAIMFLLTCNLGEVISIFIATVLGWPIPLLATQILWVNLVTDSLPALALGVDSASTDLMKRKPRPSDESFFAQKAWLKALIGGSLIGILTLLAFVIGIVEQGISIYNISNIDISNPLLIRARTMAFIVLTVSQLFFAFTMRSEEEGIIKVGIFKNKFLNISLIVGVLLQLTIIYVPFLANAFGVEKLSIFDMDIVIIFALIPVIVNELLKKIIKIKI